MSESKHNFQALLAATLPAAMSPGREIQFGIQHSVQPSQHIVLVPAEKMREAVDDGPIEEGANVVDMPRWEIQDDAGTWTKLPRGMRAHQLGTPLDPKDCDLVVSLMPVVIATNIALPGSSPSRPQFPMSQGPEIVIKRLNLAKFCASHEERLAGQEPEKKLVLV